MINNQTCTRCVNDKTVKGIRFGKDGLCSHCACYDRYRERLTDYGRLEELFRKKLKRNGSYDYDVAMGFSGGKDSTYVLYQLVKKYGLRVKAYTLDNGFMSAEARVKIDRLVSELGVEHEYVVCDMELLKSTYRYMTSHYLSPCLACSFLGYAVMINYASRVNAAVGIHGRSPYQMFRGLSDSHDDVFRPFIDAGLDESDNDPALLYEEIIGKIDRLVDPKLAGSIKESLLGDMREKGARDFLAYFLYHPYDTQEIVSFLEENTSWRVESEEEHFDCTIHHGALYLKNLVARRSHLMPEYSVMINQGAMSREEAYKKMSSPTDEELSKKELMRFCEEVGLSYKATMLKARLYSKRWW